MVDGDRTAAILDLPRDLEDATDVAGDDHLRAGCFDIVQLAPAEPLRHLRLRQVVGSRGAATDLRLLQRNNFKTGNHAQQGTWLAADLLSVAEVTGVMIGHLERNGC